jgi:hypothetical protein
MSGEATQEILDTLADLQLKTGVGGVGRDRILVTILPPPADAGKREQIKRQLDDLVPELLTRYESAGALPPGYELTRQGWLRTKLASRVLEIIKSFLHAFRDHVTSGSTTQRLEWADLAAHGVADSEYHLACIVAQCFELQTSSAVQSWDGKNTPRASFGLPIDIDELLDVVDASDLVAKRKCLSYERLHARKVIAGEITGDVRRAIEHIYKIFAKAGSWPLSRTLHVQLAKEGISLEKIASGRFARGSDVHTEGARTMLTLAGLLVPVDADDDRRLIVQVLRYIGDHARTHPEERMIGALTVMDRLGIDEADIVSVAKMLQCQGSTYVNTGSDTFDVARMNFYLSPTFIPHADAKDLWDIVLNEEEETRRWQVRGLEGIFPAIPVDMDGPPEEVDEPDLAPPRAVKMLPPQGPADVRASKPDAAWIFYSWQSDLDHKTNWNFIEECLRRATKAIQNDDSILVEPVIDRDTRGVAGSPDIGATIFAKIETSAAFVCDVSCINRDKGGRPAPNPNVLVELGYAAKALGWDRIILVLNEAFGPVEDLPFDLRVKRTIKYRLASGDAKAQVRSDLAKTLEVAIRTILSTPIKPNEEIPTVLDTAVAGVTSSAADAGARIRDYMRWLAQEIDGLKPKRDAEPHGKPEDEVLVEAIRSSLPLVEGFAKLADAIARHNAREPALSLMSSFEGVLGSYDMPTTHNGGSWRESDFDFQRFVGHELFVTLAATLLHGDRLELLREILRVDLYVSTIRGRGLKPWSALYEYCRLLDDVRKKRLNLNFYSVRAELLKERHSSGDLGKLVPFDAFVEADYFLYLASDLKPQSEDAWHPLTLMYIGYHAPAFLARAEKRTYAERLIAAFQLTDIDTFRARYAERSRSIAKMFPTGAIRDLGQMDPTWFATR